MEENQGYEILESESNEEHISFADKVIGVITSPKEILTKLAANKPRSSDWVIPIILMIVVVSVSNILYFYIPDLKYQLQEKQYEAIQKSLDSKIESEDITPEQAKTQMELAKKQMEQFGFVTIIFQVIGGAIFLFINFFIVNGVFYLFIKYVLNGEGDFKSAMSAYGSVYYILILQAIFALLLTLITNKFYTGLNIYSFSDMEMLSFEGFIFRKLDLFLIWFYVLLGISYAKFFKSESSKAYIILVLSIWIISSALFYYLSTVSTWFQGLAM